MTGALINTRRAADGSLLAEIRGEIDIETSHRLRAVLVDAADRLLPTRIVVDLLYVTFIDSTGIGALAAGRNAAHRRGIPFTVRQPNGFVTAQLRQTGLYDTLTADR
jgi:anti-sigma B factor antagonist